MNFARPTRTVAIAAALLFPLGLSGCATKGYVNSRLEELRESTAQDLDGVRGEVTGLRNSTEEALDRARFAGESAEEARELALGKAGLEELNRYTVYFGFNEDVIDEGQKPVLDRAASEIAEHPEAIVDVYGFADPQGSDRYNLELGQRRAMEVVRHLAAGAPHQLSRYAAVSYGERQVRGMDPDAEDHARSRRVVISLIRRIPLNGNPESPQAAQETTRF